MTKKIILFITLSFSSGALGALVTQPAQDETEKLIKEFTDAAYTNKLEKVTNILKTGMDINSKGPGGQTALQRAASQGHVAVVEFLLKNGANPNLADNQGITALIAAVMSYPSYQSLMLYKELLECLLQKALISTQLTMGGKPL